MNRIVVQPGRTLRSGRRGRWFESSQSDQSYDCCKGRYYLTSFFVASVTYF